MEGIASLRTRHFSVISTLPGRRTGSRRVRSRSAWGILVWYVVRPSIEPLSRGSLAPGRSTGGRCRAETAGHGRVSRMRQGDHARMASRVMVLRTENGGRIPPPERSASTNPVEMVERNIRFVARQDGRREVERGRRPRDAADFADRHRAGSGHRLGEPACPWGRIWVKPGILRCG